MDGCGADGCGQCEGDCDADSDCKAGLTCFQRDTGDSVPGCSGVATTDWDYCLPVPVIVNVNDAYPQNQYVSSYCPSGKTYSRHACGSNAQASLTSGASAQYGPFTTDEYLQSGGHCSCCCNCHTVWVECQ